MVTYNAQRMLHRKQDPQDMETIQDYRHTKARERLRDSEELQTNLPLIPYVQTLQTNDSKLNSPSSWTTHNQGTSRLQDRDVMHQPTVDPDPTHLRRLPERHDHWCSFVDLSAAYDTVNHRILMQKLYNITQDSPLCGVIQNMLSIRMFYVELNNESSRWRKQKTGLPQGSVLSPILFNIYTNDQPLHNGTRGFIYADDLCVTSQQSSLV